MVAPTVAAAAAVFFPSEKELGDLRDGGGGGHIYHLRKSIAVRQTEFRDFSTAFSLLSAHGLEPLLASTRTHSCEI